MRLRLKVGPGRGDWDVGLGDVGLGDVGLGDVGLRDSGTWDSGTRGRVILYKLKNQVYLSRPRVSTRPQVPASHVPESHVSESPRLRVPTSPSPHVPRPRVSHLLVPVPSSQFPRPSSHIPVPLLVTAH